MPTINKITRQEQPSRERWDHHEVYGTPRWKTLRNSYIMYHPLCEVCAAAGRTTLAESVHHIIEFSTGKTKEERERLAFDPSNLQSVCFACHRDIHKKLKKAKTK